jgi:membrane protease YdiL (CAAX protease family)
MKSRNDYPGFWHSVLLSVAFIGVQIVLMIPVGVLDALFQFQLGSHPAVVGIVNIVACAAVLGLGWLIGRTPLSEVFALRRVDPLAIAGVIVSIAGAVILLSEADNLTRAVLPQPAWVERILRNLAFSSDHVWASFFLLVIVAPVTEELMFRGLILRGLMHRLSFTAAALLSSILFGAVHLNPWQFVSALALGLIFAWWYARTRSLLPCLLGHALANSVVFWHRFFPFEIRGFNGLAQLDTTSFQPLWFDMLGLLLLAAGSWLFCRATPPVRAAVEPASEPESWSAVPTDAKAPPMVAHATLQPGLGDTSPNE